MRSGKSWGAGLRPLLLAGLISAGLAPFTAGAQVPTPQDRPYPGVMEVNVDATDLDHRVFQVRQRLPVQPGRLTLLHARYLPGAHGPYGSIERIAGLRIEAGGQVLPWVRDTVEPSAFHVEIPKGVSSIDIQHQFLSAVSRETGRVVMTREMLNLQWISLVLYPAGHYADRIQVQASVRLPEGWKQASALREQGGGQGRDLNFAPVSLETLMDSPLFAGLHMRRIELDGPGHPRPVTLNIMADTPEELEANETQIATHRQLVTQADKLFASRHFEHYDFLLSISDRLGGIGLEHHQSSENGVRPGYFKDWAKRPGARSLLPHEYTHSWNGKFRRPADLWTPNYNVPMQDSLLWLYEGQTDYWGRVLAVRAGLVSAAQMRDSLAETVAMLSHRAGRVWRNLQDTTNEGAMGKSRTEAEWINWQRGADYYAESGLIWLDADTLIREKSGGQRSLDDFAQRFYGVQDGRMKPLTYRFEDVVTTLNEVQAHDWRGFLRERLDGHGPGAPLDGIARAGWRLAWAETPSDFQRQQAEDGESRVDDFSYSLGLVVRRDGRVDRVLWDSPAFRAGMSRVLTVLAVNGVAYKGERLAAAITAGKSGKAPLDFLVREGDGFRHLQIDYRDGLRYPRLERVDEAVERLDAGILKAR